jgi:hypothetical protein
VILSVARTPICKAKRGAFKDTTPDILLAAAFRGAIERAGRTARDAVWANDFGGLADAVRQSYAVQRAEAMDPLAGDPAAAGNAVLAACRPVAWKYCGGGFGGYAVYLFNAQADRDAACALPGFRQVEPYVSG